MIKKQLIAAMAALFMLSAPAAFAYGPPEGGPPNGMGGPPMGGRGHGERRRPEHLTPEQRAEALTKIKALRVYQLTEILALEASQSAEFFSQLSRFDDEIASLRESQMKTVRALRRAVSKEQKGESISPETYVDLTDKLRAGERATMEARTQFMDNASKLLSPSQLARFTLYQMEFERRLRRYIQQAAKEEGSLKALGSPKGLVEE